MIQTDSDENGSNNVSMFAYILIFQGELNNIISDELIVLSTGAHCCYETPCTVDQLSLPVQEADVQRQHHMKQTDSDENNMANASMGLLTQVQAGLNAVHEEVVEVEAVTNFTVEVRATE